MGGGLEEEIKGGLEGKVERNVGLVEIGKRDA